MTNIEKLMKNINKNNYNIIFILKKNIILYLNMSHNVKCVKCKSRNACFFKNGTSVLQFCEFCKDKTCQIASDLNFDKIIQQATKLKNETEKNVSKLAYKYKYLYEANTSLFYLAKDKRDLKLMFAMIDSIKRVKRSGENVEESLKLETDKIHGLIEKFEVQPVINEVNRIKKEENKGIPEIIQSGV